MFRWVGLFGILALVAVAQADIVTGLSARWKFDEGSGTTAADSSGNGHTGTLGATTTAPTWLTSGCQLTNCLSFDGGDVVDVTSFNITDIFTMALWIYPVSGGTPNNYGVMVSATAGNPGFYYMNGGANAGKVSWNPGTDHFSTATLTANTWSHVALTYNSGSYVIYINGVSSGSGSITATSAPVAKIGMDTANEGCQCRLDEVWLFTRALSSADITELIAATTPSGSVLRRRIQY